MKNNTYSVIIPAYNCKSTIESSIRSALNQTYVPMEIIVIDDCSTDGTWDIITGLADRYDLIKAIRLPINSGVAVARNTAFDLSNGDFAATLDSDDLWISDKMEKQIELMCREKCDFSCTGYRFIDLDSNDMDKSYHIPEKILYRNMLAENYVGLSTLVITRDIYTNYRMDSKYSHEDYAFVMTLLRDGKIGLGIDSPLMLYRISQESRSGDKKKAAINRWHIYRDLLGMNIISSAAAFAKYAYRGYKKHRNLG